MENKNVKVPDWEKNIKHFIFCGWNTEC